MILQDSYVDLQTPSGVMRTYHFRPLAEGRYPVLLFYSEIFQVTEPIRRTAAFYAGHGFHVLVPEVFHEFEPIGTVLAYDQAGADAGNAHKIGKSVAAYDQDTRTLIEFGRTLPGSTGTIGALGICLGGHLAFRAAMHKEIAASTCFYATDIHKSTLGLGMSDDSLQRIPEIDGELMMVWGRQDPHIPLEGRQTIYHHLSTHQRNFTWHEFNGAHAFLRDEGHRYDPELAHLCQSLALRFFSRCLR